MSVIFQTVHGSRLYGLATPQSDNDQFIVTSGDSRKVKHRQRGTLDTTEASVHLFLELAASGSHQSVEALFSPHKKWGDESYRPLIDSYRITGQEVFEKYERTITKFAFSDFKRRRHAARLAINLQQLRESGRIIPTLTEDQRDRVTRLATEHVGRDLLHRIGF